MIKMRMDSRKGERRLKELKAKMIDLGQTRCVLTPSVVLTCLCEQRGQALLNVMPDTVRKDIEKRWVPKVAAATKASASKDGKLNQAAIARAWRYGAYLHADKLWAAVTKKAWGRVAPSTIVPKMVAMDPEMEQWAERRREAAARREAARPAGEQPAGGRRRGRRPTRVWAQRIQELEAYGVRARERGRRWYDIQKMKQTSGTREDRAETNDLIEIFIRGRSIGTGRGPT